MPIPKINTGYIEVICGPMFSGKTEELIRRINKATFTKKNVIVFKPEIDKRYSDNFIVSHNGEKIKCISIKNLDEVNKFCDSDIFAFDEFQFFNQKIINICLDLVKKGKRVIAAGLDRDSNAIPFGAMPEILAHADYITKLNSVCMQCGDIATYSYRIVENEEQILVGESEKYEARCVTCFYK
tara:strand:- start:620 stop:1168 length:549 start_codon:yes stop_codon:yes gene_type:complete